MKPYFSEGGATLYHGDCRDILPQLGIFDLCLTDPPYGVGLKYDGFNDTESNLRELIRTAFPLIKSSGIVTLLTCGNGNQYKYPEPDWTLAWIVQGSITRARWGFAEWEPILAYGRDPFLRDGLGCRGDTFHCNAASVDSLNHPCPKPLPLWKWLITRGSTRPRDKILDPFAGSGTTLLAARQLGHEVVGIEQSELYCEVIVKKLSQQPLNFSLDIK